MSDPVSKEAASREWVEAKLETIDAHIERMDMANTVLNDTITRVPTELQQATSALSSLFNERLAGIQREIDKQNAVNSEFMRRIEQTASIQFEALDKAVTQNHTMLTRTAANKVGAGELRSTYLGTVALVVSVITVVTVVVMAVIR